MPEGRTTRAATDVAATLPNPLGGARHVYHWREGRIAYVERGPEHQDTAKRPPLVFIHSIHAAAWSAEWRRNVPIFAQQYRCIAPDLLGFGASDRPSIRYTASLYLDLLRDFLRDVVREPAVLIGSSLGATYAIAIAAAHPELVAGVTAVGPAGVSRLVHPGGTANALVERLFRTPRVGRALFSALVSRPSIRFFLKDIYADRTAMDEETTNLFYVSANQPNARFAPAAFVGMQLNCDIRGALPAVRCPLLLAWGSAARQTPATEAEPMRTLAPHATFAPIPGGDLPHDERPEPFNTALNQFLQQL